MTVDPEIQSLIDWGVAVNERHGALGLAELRPVLRDELDHELHRRGVVVEPGPAVSRAEIPVAGGGILARIYTPSGAGPHPVFVHLHGGGFVFGTVDSLLNDAKCAHICVAAECVVVTAEYRLAPESRFPTAPEDCYAALLWVAENADPLNVDPARIAVGGESAGGNLAAATALMARDRCGPPLALQLLEVPVTDLSDQAADYPSVARFGEGYGLDRSDLATIHDAYLAHPADGSSPYASPLHAESLTGVAPAHVITAEYDILRDSGERYARRLESAGVETVLRRFRGHTHGSSILWQTWKPARAWMEDATGALRRGLHEEASRPRARRTSGHARVQ